MSTVLKVTNVEKYYGTKTSLTKALDDISLTVEEGEFVGIMGASGSGKTIPRHLSESGDPLSGGHQHRHPGYVGPHQPCVECLQFAGIAGGPDRGGRY